MFRRPVFGVRGGDIDNNGVVWASLRAATWAASTGASAKARSTGRPRPAIIAPRAGASISIPGPASKASARTAPRSSYYTWVDQHNTLGLGEDVPMSTANLGDGFVALKDGKMIAIRLPYPLSFYAKGFDGRIDDPNAGWKGRGLWTRTATARLGSRKAARAANRWRSTSSCVPTRWRIESDLAHSS